MNGSLPQKRQLLFPSREKFISAVDDSSDFQQVFASLPNIQESFVVSSTQYASQVKEDWFEQILDVIRSNVVVTVNAGQSSNQVTINSGSLAHLEFLIFQLALI